MSRACRQLLIASLCAATLCIANGQTPAPIEIQERIPATIHGLVDQARTLPIEYAADILLPVIGKGTLKAYRRFERELLVDLYRQASDARMPMAQFVSYDAMDAVQLFAAATAIGAQKLDRLSIQNRAVALLQSRDGRQARILVGNSPPALIVEKRPTACAELLLDVPVGYFESIFKSMDLETAAATPARTTAYLADFLLFLSNRKNLSLAQRERLSLSLSNGFNAVPAELPVLLTVNGTMGFHGLVESWAQSLDDIPSARMLLLNAYRTFVVRQLTAPRCHRGGLDALNKTVQAFSSDFDRLAVQYPPLTPLTKDEMQSSSSPTSLPIPKLSENGYDAITTQLAAWENAVHAQAPRPVIDAAFAKVESSIVSFLRAKRPFELDGSGTGSDAADINALHDWRTNLTITICLQRFVELGADPHNVIDALVPRLVAKQRDAYPAMYVLLYRQMANLARLKGTKFSRAAEAIDRAVATSGDLFLNAYFAADRALAQPHDPQMLSSGGWMRPEY